MSDVGIPLEQDLAYDAHTGACPVGPNAPWPAAQRVRVSGWNHISPNNKAQPLMQSLVNYGATVVAVDANNWFDYESGIFDSCSKDADLGHAVLAVGYGENYWKIQNSWGLAGGSKDTFGC
jgi:cathepsin L